MPDPDSHERSTPWRLVAIATIVVGTAMLVGPPAGARGLAAVSALVLVALILFAVSRPSPARPDDAAVDPWIVLCNCPNVQAAFFVRAALEGSQIESLIPDEHSSTPSTCLAIVRTSSSSAAGSSSLSPTSTA